MKTGIWYLLAAIYFFIASIIYFFFVEDKSVVFGGAFAALGCAFVAIYVRSRKKGR